MGKIANQMALELFLKIKEKIKERKEREKWYKRTLKNSKLSSSFKFKSSGKFQFCTLINDGQYVIF